MKFSIVSYSEVDTVATGGKGDREIFVYKANKAGKFTQLHCLRGHTGTSHPRRILARKFMVFFQAG